jgi:disulfide bond formation protein DsbB
MMSTLQRTLVLVAILALGAVGVALVSQYVFDMQPCAWCVLQRLIYLAIAAVCLLTAWAPPLLRRVGGLLALVLAAGGVAAAYYQYTVAAKLLSCDQTFADKFISATGLDGAVPTVFGIYATCMDAVVKVLGVEYALWSLALFAILLLIALRGLFKRA